MSSIRFTGDVLPDGSIRPPKEIRLSPGTVEVTVLQHAGVALGQTARRRHLGTLRGTVQFVAPDFDAPLDDFQGYMA